MIGCRYFLIVAISCVVIVVVVTSVQIIHLLVESKNSVGVALAGRTGKMLHDADEQWKIIQPAGLPRAVPFYENYNIPPLPEYMNVMPSSRMAMACCTNKHGTLTTCFGGKGIGVNKEVKLGKADQIKSNNGTLYSHQVLNDYWTWSNLNYEWKKLPSNATVQGTYHGGCWTDQGDNVWFGGGLVRVDKETVVVGENSFHRHGQDMQSMPRLAKFAYWTDHQGKYIYLFGGLDHLGRYYNDIMRMPSNKITVNSTWMTITEKAPIEPRIGTSAFHLDNAIYLFGGQSKVHDCFADLWLFNDRRWVQLYDHMEDKLQPNHRALPQHPGCRRFSSAVMNSGNGMLKLRGGQSKGNQTMMDTWIFYPSRAKWIWAEGSHHPNVLPFEDPVTKKTPVLPAIHLASHWSDHLGREYYFGGCTDACSVLHNWYLFVTSPKPPTHMAQLSTSTNKNADYPYMGLWTGGAGAVDTLSVNQQKPSNYTVVDSLLGVEQHRRESVEYIRRWLESNNDFLLTQVLPVRDTNNIKVKYTEWILDPSLAERVPELTPSPMVTVHGNQREQSLYRKGKGARVSYDIIYTDEGRTLWRMYLENMLLSTVIVMKLDIARELFNVEMVTCMKNMYMMRFPYLELDRLLGEETANFGLMSKGPYAFSLMLTDVRKEMTTNGAEPNLIIMPPGSVHFLKNQANKQHQTMLMNGPKAAVLQNSYNYAPAATGSVNNVPSIEGLRVEELGRVSELSDIGPVDPSMVTREIGQHFILSDEKAYVYNPQKDRMQLHTKAQYLDMLELWDAAGTAFNPRLTAGAVNVLDRLFGAGTGANTTFQDIIDSKPTYATRVAEALGRTAQAAQVAFNAVLPTALSTKANWLAAIRAGVPLPVNVLVQYPKMQINMCSAVLVQTGSATGNMYVAFKDMKEAIDPTTKELMGNLTMWSKAVIRDRSKVVVMPNVKFAGFVSMGERYVSAVSVDETAQNTPLLDIRGTGSGLPVYDQFKVYSKDRFDYSSRPFYETLRNLDTEFPDYNPSKPFYADETIPNRLTFQTTQYNYNPITKDYSNIVSSQGHIPDKGNQPGARRVLDGFQLYYDEFNLKKVMGYCA